MNYAQSVLANALSDPSKLKAPPIFKHLDIRPGKGGDTAQQTLEKLPGYWLIDVASFPENRPVIEKWIALAAEKAYQLRGVDDAESKRWYAAAAEMTACCHHCNRALFARQRAQAAQQ